jgi:CRISPR-associated protein Csm5
MSPDNSDYTKARYDERSEIEITTVTPVFIGTGEEVSPLSYVTDGKRLLVVPNDFLERLTPNQQQKYVNWIEQQMREQRRGDLSLESFLKGTGSPVDFVRRMNPRVVSFRRRPGKRGFREHIKHPDGLPYIPGSEIKGALRTAILHTMLDNSDVYNEALGRQLLEVQRRRKSIQKVAGPMEDNLLRVEGHPNDAKYDLLRFISITDTTPFTQDALFIEQIEVFGRGANHFIPPFDFETLVAKQKSRFVIHFGGPEKVFSIMGLAEMRDMLNLKDLLKACYNRSQAVLNEESEYFSRRDSGLLSVVKSLLQQNKPESPLLRLGAGQGFLSTTVDLEVKQRDPSMYETIREEVSRQRGWRTYPNNFPKTRRVVVDANGYPSMLLGWVKIKQIQN